MTCVVIIKTKKIDRSSSVWVNNFGFSYAVQFKCLLLFFFIRAILKHIVKNLSKLQKKWKGHMKPLHFKSGFKKKNLPHGVFSGSTFDSCRLHLDNSWKRGKLGCCLLNQVRKMNIDHGSSTTVVPRACGTGESTSVLRRRNGPSAAGRWRGTARDEPMVSRVHVWHLLDDVYEDVVAAFTVHIAIVSPHSSRNRKLETRVRPRVCDWAVFPGIWPDSPDDTRTLCADTSDFLLDNVGRGVCGGWMGWKFGSHGLVWVWAGMG